MKKELKSGTLSADKSADSRPTVGGVNVIAVLDPPSRGNVLSSKITFIFFYLKIVDFYRCKNRSILHMLL